VWRSLREKWQSERQGDERVSSVAGDMDTGVNSDCPKHPGNSQEVDGLMLAINRIYAEDTVHQFNGASESERLRRLLGKLYPIVKPIFTGEQPTVATPGNAGQERWHEKTKAAYLQAIINNDPRLKLNGYFSWIAEWCRENPFPAALAQAAAGDANDTFWVIEWNQHAGLLYDVVKDSVVDRWTRNIHEATKWERRVDAERIAENHGGAKVMQHGWMLPPDDPAAGSPNKSRKEREDE
jgi:hypothetical protein